MATEPNDQAARSGLQDFQQRFEHYRKVMFFECYKVLENRIEAEEAAGEATIKALRGLPKKLTTSLEAWLRIVARNTAHDVQRRIIRKRGNNKGKHNSRLDVPTDAFRVSQIQLDTRRFLERMVGLIDGSFLEDVGLYLTVLFGSFTEEQLAEQHGIPHKTMKNRRERGRKAGREAAVVVCLTTDAGDGSNRCPEPLNLARGQRYTPELLRKVKHHITECTRCQRRQNDKEALLKTIFVIPAAMVWYLLDGMRTTAAKVTVGAAVAAAIILLPTISAPEPNPVPLPAPGPDRPTGVTGIEPVPLPTTSPPTTPPTTTTNPTTSDPAPTVEPPAPPPVTAPQPATTTTATPPPGPTEQPRDDSPPTVLDSWIEHERIAAAENGTCPTGEPTSAAVRVIFDREVVSAELLVTGQGTTPMSDAGGGVVRVGRVGPVLDDEHDSVTIKVRFVGTNGAQVTKRLGEICVTLCRRNSHD